MAQKQRLLNELTDMAKSPPPLCSAGPVKGDMTNWNATIMGPPTSPYQGGMFKLKIQFPKEYPSHPPRIQFVTQIYHLNVSDRGGICLDILSKNWKPEISVGKILLSICSLLTNPNPDDPLDRAKADVYKRDRIKYSQTAQQWTQLYAK